LRCSPCWTIRSLATLTDYVDDSDNSIQRRPGGQLIYSVLASLDGFIEDESGAFGWAVPDEEVHRFINELERSTSTMLLGRRMYEVMNAWEDEEWLANEPDVIREFGELWREADKVVYSTSLPQVSTLRTRIERDFDRDEVLLLKDSAERDISVGGPGLAAHALKAGLVDECRLFIAPIIVGGGKRWLPEGLRLELELLEERRFGNGMAYLRYRTAA
jgi:dihydrofolate reductase